jgi:hypothetical protein
MAPDRGVGEEEPADAGAIVGAGRPSHWHRLELQFLHPPSYISLFPQQKGPYLDPCSTVL